MRDGDGEGYIPELELTFEKLELTIMHNEV